MSLAEVTSGDAEGLADIIWFIKGRLTACQDRGVSCELGSEHIEALRRFRSAFYDIGQVERRAEAAERREKLANHFASLVQHSDSNAKRAAKELRKALLDLLAQVDAKCGGRAEGSSPLVIAANNARRLLEGRP